MPANSWRTMNSLNILQQHLTSGPQASDKVNASSSSFPFPTNSGISSEKPLLSLTQSDIVSLSDQILRTCVEGLLEEENPPDNAVAVEQMTSDSSSSSSSGEEVNEK